MANTYNDHLTVRYSIDYNNSRQRVAEEADRPKPSPRTWKTSYFDEGVSKEGLCRELLGLDGDEFAVLSSVCDATMSRRIHSRNGRPAAYNWTRAIVDLRRACLWARRRMQRARNERRVAFATAKVTLKTKIRASKKSCFEGHCQSAKTTP